MFVRIGRQFINMNQVAHVVDVTEETKEKWPGVKPGDLVLFTTMVAGNEYGECWPERIILRDDDRKAMLRWLDGGPQWRHPAAGISTLKVYAG